MVGSLILASVVGYLLGAVPSGYLIARFAAGVDVRTLGSRKTGASNVRSLLGWKGFVPVLVLDAAKGALAVLLTVWTAAGADPWVQVAAGLAAMVGHSWPLHLEFRGGRGVATGLGAMLVLVPGAVLLGALVAVPVIFVSRYMSLGSIIGAALIPIVTLAFVLLLGTPWPYFLFALVGGALIIFWHKDNIRRLRTGTERTI